METHPFKAMAQPSDSNDRNRRQMKATYSTVRGSSPPWLGCPDIPRETVFHCRTSLRLPSTYIAQSLVRVKETTAPQYPQKHLQTGIAYDGIGLRPDVVYTLTLALIFLP